MVTDDDSLAGAVSGGADGDEAVADVTAPTGTTVVVVIEDVVDVPGESEGWGSSAIPATAGTVKAVTSAAPPTAAGAEIRSSTKPAPTTSITTTTIATIARNANRLIASSFITLFQRGRPLAPTKRAD